MSYHPQLPPLLARVEPDAKYQAALDDLMPVFVEEVIAGRERLRELGAVIAPKEEAPVNGDYGGLGVSLADLEVLMSLRGVRPYGIGSSVGLRCAKFAGIATRDIACGRRTHP